VQVRSLHRYPVKSMLGEQLDCAHVGDHGLLRDRGLALVDTTTGLVATAKHPRLWRDLLRYTAKVHGDQVLISSPGRWTLDSRHPDLDALLSTGLGRSVQLRQERPRGSRVERPDPEDVLTHGVQATVPAALLEIGQGSSGSNFVDYAPVHLITTATLAELDVEPRRYRPNIVIETPAGTPPYAENDWVGHQLDIGDVVLEIVLPTPRCAVPTLEHGDLPRAPQAVRKLMTDNRIDVPGFGVLPCAGAYARVLKGGTIDRGAPVAVAER
jgi:uncharacterized protein